MYEDIMDVHKMLTKILKGAYNLGDSRRWKDNIQVDPKIWTAFT
jgi:hypothetical protein